jgi:hypothetical protein
MTTNGISWPSDLMKYKIGNKSQQWLNVTDPRVINWMRIATLPNFRKLWARIDDNLPSGQYSVQITNCSLYFIIDYSVSQYGAAKSFVLSTSNFFGTKNKFLPIMYIIMGSVCLIIGVLFTIRKIKKDKKR